MIATLTVAISLAWIVIGVGCWLGRQLLRQNGRILLRLDGIEGRLAETEFAGINPPVNGTSATDDRAGRFGQRSLARSKLKRDGLKAGTPAPDFRLPCLNGSEVSLQDFRGRRLLLVFSDPHCGPCNAIAPELEKFHRQQPEITSLMISRGEPKENRVKVNEHTLTFQVLLQQRWEISRLYAMFATPMAYLIDEQGVITNDVAVGIDQIRSLLTAARSSATPARPMSPTACNAPPA